MTTDNLEFKSNEVIVLSFSNLARINENKINQFCRDNNLQLLKFIEFKYCHNSNKIIELIELIKRLTKPPMLIMDVDAIYNPLQIITCSVLSTLALLNRIHLYFFLQKIPNANTGICVYEKNSKMLLLLAEVYLRSFVPKSTNSE